MDNVDILKQKGHNFLWVNGYLWMWDIPIEKEIQKGLAEGAYGDVLVAGYGLGLSQKYLILNPKVKSVLTVEKFPEVIKECKKVYGKIYGEVIIEDFYNFRPSKMFDCVIGDICEDIVPAFLGDYKKFKFHALKCLKPDGRFIAWGQDFFEYLLKNEQTTID